MRQFIAAMSLAALLAPFASQAAVTTAFGPGQLIKGSNPTVYYYATDGHRYVFPNEKTYFTWYPDFKTVVQIPDNAMAAIPLGRSNVTYRPGRKMVKVTTDPKVYVVDQNGVLRHVATEQLAKTLYGLSWQSQIEDLPDAFFANYRTGTPVNQAPDFKPSDVMTQSTTISQDKQMDETQMAISIGGSETGFVPSTTTIKRGMKVTWTNNDAVPHTVKGVSGTGSNATNWGSGQLNPGDTYSYTFNNTGSYDYSCEIHQSMDGTVNVVN